ncbi:MAG: hypothetical protein L6R45_27395 [Anaerolineae bacterium]|nr:hypothetical protein [Anaerolineae bacterium]
MKCRGIFMGHQISLAVLLAFLLVVVSLALLELTAEAARRGKGPGCGGDLLDGTEQNGDIIMVMASTFWNSGGPVITKNLEIEGGWQVKSGESCSASTVYTDTSKFEFVGPNTRSTANEFGAPVMTIDPSVLTLTVKHIIFKQGGFVPQGGGLNGVISNSAYILLENVAFVDDGGGADTGAGLFLQVRGNSRLVISGSQFLTNTAQDTGGGFELHVFGGSQVTLANAEVRGNRSLDGNGGGGRIVLNRGTVTIANSTFSGNLGNQGFGGGLSVEGVGSVYYNWPQKLDHELRWIEV